MNNIPLFDGALRARKALTAAGLGTAPAEATAERVTLVVDSDICGVNNALRWAGYVVAGVGCWVDSTGAYELKFSSSGSELVITRVRAETALSAAISKLQSLNRGLRGTKEAPALTQAYVAQVRAEVLRALDLVAKEASNAEVH